MKKLLSEKNVAAFLFVLVIVAFSFAHEDSKKKSHLYEISALKSGKFSSPVLGLVHPQQEKK